jgi:hypothetical protein
MVSGKGDRLHSPAVTVHRRFAPQISSVLTGQRFSGDKCRGDCIDRPLRRWQRQPGLDLGSQVFHVRTRDKRTAVEPQNHLTELLFVSAIFAARREAPKPALGSGARQDHQKPLFQKVSGCGREGRRQIQTGQVSEVASSQRIGRGGDRNAVYPQPIVLGGCRMTGFAVRCRPQRRSLVDDLDHDSFIGWSPGKCERIPPLLT